MSLNYINEISNKGLIRQFQDKSSVIKSLCSTNKVILELNEDFEKIDNISGLNVNLYEHQKTIIKAMIDLENNRNILIAENKSHINNDIVAKQPIVLSRRRNAVQPDNGNAVISAAHNSSEYDKYRLKYNAAVLSDPPGLGKTFNILGTILANKRPKILPDIIKLNNNINEPVSIVRRKFAEILKPTIIFVSSSVVKQWEDTINNFTNLKLFSVYTIVELRRVIKMIYNKTINNYDVILVKNGRITRNLNIPELKMNHANAYIYDVFSKITHITWSRVVIDDFDTIGLPKKAIPVNGLFTWYVSATRKFIPTITTSHNFSTTSELLKNAGNFSCGNIMSNNYLFSYLNLRNNPEFVKRSTNLTIPKFYIVKVDNPNDMYMGYIGALGEEGADRVNEMLNGDAVAAAAEAVGIKSQSVADIFEKILGDKFKNFKFATDVLSFIKYNELNQDSWLPLEQHPLFSITPEKVTYGKTELLKFEPIEYKYKRILNLLEEAKEEYKDNKNNYGKAIDRVKSNILNGSCPICLNDLRANDECIINKCCGFVLCRLCGICSQKISRNGCGVCCNCRFALRLTDLIYISKDFDLNRITQEDMDSEGNENPQEEIKKPEAITKFSYICDIINKIDIPHKERYDINFLNLSKGNNYMTKAKIRKVLIFANFDETLNKVIETLKEKKIKFERLGGTLKNIARLAQEFNESKESCALIINSVKYCSGLNLQTATTVIFTHLIIDINIEMQVIGRALRLGRTHSLEVWYLLYNNEKKRLLETHSMTKIEDEPNEEENNNANAADNANAAENAAENANNNNAAENAAENANNNNAAENAADNAADNSDDTATEEDSIVSNIDEVSDLGSLCSEYAHEGLNNSVYISNKALDKIIQVSNSDKNILDELKDDFENNFIIDE